MSASFRLLILLAAIGAAGGWLANEPPIQAHRRHCKQ